MQVRTQDDAGRFFTPEYLSARQSMTPEGFLLCKDVPIARIGTLIYDESELVGPEGPLIDGGPGGQVTIERSADEVFRDETLASFEGKPVTLSHPDDFVNPSNWRELSVGTTQNVRRGEGVEQDLMLADLLITDSEAIQEVRNGLRQVSCGYDADYEQLAPGRGRQTNIVGNHVALVARGRCGPRCAIGDSDNMATKDQAPKKRGWKDRLRTAFRAKDEAALEEALEEAPTSDETPEEVDSGLDRQVLARMDRLEAMIEKLAGCTKDEGAQPEPTQEVKTDDTVLNAEPAAHNPQAAGAIYTGDSAAIAVAMADLRSRAEILSPGITFQTKDAPTADHLCSCRRAALSRAMQTEDGKAAVEPFLLGKTLDSLTADQVASAFIGASELMKHQNNTKGARPVAATRDFGRTFSVADINKANREHWNR